MASRFGPPKATGQRSFDTPHRPAIRPGGTVHGSAATGGLHFRLAPAGSFISVFGETTKAVNPVRTILAITKALADANRVRILCALNARGELCVCQLQELLGLAASSTSQHLSLLAAAGLVESRKEGRWAFYRLADLDALPEEAGEVLAWLCRRVAGDKHIAEDRRRLTQILNYTPEELCQRQAQGLACCSSAPETPAAAKSRKASRGCC